MKLARIIVILQCICPTIFANPINNFSIPDIDASLKQYQQTLEQVTTNPDISWNNTIFPLEQATNSVIKDWNLIKQLAITAGNQAAINAYNKAIKNITGFNKQIMSSHKLYNAYQTLKTSTEYNNLSKQQQDSIDQMLVYFKSTATNLSEDNRQRFWQLISKQATAANTYITNLSNYQKNYKYAVTNKNELLGIPSSYAAQFLKQGYIDLDNKSVQAVVSFAKNRQLREKIYKAYAESASNGPYDNTEVVKQLLEIRKDIAKLTGFDNYYQYAIATRFAPNAKQIEEFLYNLKNKFAAQASSELKVISMYAKKKDKILKLEAWDLPYYAEQYKYENYWVNDNLERELFDLPDVVNSIHNIIDKIFNLKISMIENAATWDKDVLLYKVQDNNKNTLGYFYSDLLARPNKQLGTFIQQYCQGLELRDGQRQLPVVFFNASFRPEEKRLNFNEVSDLFYQYGNLLNLLCRNSYVLNLSGIEGLNQDSALFVSNFLQNFAWDYTIAKTLTGNQKSAQTFSEQMFKRLKADHDLNAAVVKLHHIQLAMLDYNTYTDGNITPPQTIIPEVRPDYMANRYASIFASGYSGIYYTHVWAQHLADNAYTEFARQGAFSPKLGNKFFNEVLKNCGQKSSLALYTNFRGFGPTM